MAAKCVLSLFDFHNRESLLEAWLFLETDILITLVYIFNLKYLISRY